MKNTTFVNLYNEVVTSQKNFNRQSLLQNLEELSGKTNRSLRAKLRHIDTAATVSFGYIAEVDKEILKAMIHEANRIGFRHEDPVIRDYAKNLAVTAKDRLHEVNRRLLDIERLERYYSL